MPTISSEYDLRKKKVKKLQEQGINPFPSQANRTATVAEFIARFRKRSKKKVTLAGRLRLRRTHGKITFGQLQDQSGMLQIVFSAQQLGDEYAAIVDQYDVGDIIEVTGRCFLTQKRERSLLVTHSQLLTKAIAPLPDKWKGIQDEETRYRKRYIDLLMKPELRDMFVKKAVFWNSMRSFLLHEGFIEVETPVLENTPGGADAEPFVTHHNALDIDLYLRISMGELWQKRLMVAGFEKTFEIGRQFRNEGISPEHLQDYTQLEWYWAYADYEKGMVLAERMYKQVIMETFGTLQFTVRGQSINFALPWKRIDYREVVQQEAGVDVLEATDQELVAVAKQRGVSVEAEASRGRVIDGIWKQIRKEIPGPVFLVHHPVTVSPLAKRSEKDSRVVERFQIIIAGSELGNGYSELNDPIDQQSRFAEQAAMRDAGDKEAQMHDQEFVEALEYGMPPTCGFGVSERLFSFLVDLPIRETVLFPLLRPKQGPEIVVADKEDESLQQFDAGITREQAKKLVFENVKDENLRKHMLATESIMKAAAKRCNAQEVEIWGIAGLLHDVDYETVDMKQHSLVGAEMLQNQNVHPLIVDAVREHNPAHGMTPKTALSKALMTLETLSGLIMACIAVRPDKNIQSVKVSSVKKKFKDTSFAAGVPRDLIAQAEPLLGITVDEAIEFSVDAMKKEANEIGL